MTCTALAVCLLLTPSSITDGGTFRVGDLRVRMWGIEAPEQGQPGASESTAALEALIGSDRLRCEVKDVDRDGHTVARCWLPDGRDLACEMVRQGQAEDWPRYSGGAYSEC